MKPAFKHFVSLRWQVACALISTSILAITALLWWALWDSSNRIDHQIKVEQQFLFNELQIETKRSYQLLAERSHYIRLLFDSFDNDQVNISLLSSLAKKLNIALFSIQGEHILGTELPPDLIDKDWLSILADKGGQYRRWYCTSACELQKFSFSDNERRYIQVQRINADTLLSNLQPNYNASIWLLTDEADAPELLHGPEIPQKLLQNFLSVPEQPAYLDLSSPQLALWSVPLNNEGRPTAAWFALPLDNIIDRARGTWWQAMTLTAGTLAVCSTIAILLIWNPLRRLSDHARNLPKLADEKTMGGAPTYKTPEGLLHDESHLLASATHELQEKLHEQRTQVNEQTHELKRLAQYDQLTGLYNRAMFEQSLHHCAIQLGRHIDSLAVIFIDLDKFKYINDTLGHEQGDLLLKKMARRFASVLRKSDILARYGGDEFVILLAEPGNKPQLCQLAHKLIQVASQPIQVNSKEVQIGISVGITECRDSQCNNHLLIKEADTAMYAAKRAGTNQIRFFDSKLEQQEKWVEPTKTSLLKNIEQNKLKLQFIPIVGLASQQPLHFEATLICPDNQGGEFSRAQLLNLLSSEQSGLLERLTSWMLTQLSKLIDSIHADRSASMEPDALPRIYIKLLPYDLLHPYLLQAIEKHCNVLPHSPQHLGVLLDESDFIRHFSYLKQRLTCIQNKGVAIALDHFGTGIGSINLIQELPIRMIRLENNFLSHDSLSDGLTKSLVTMMRKFNIAVVANGLSKHEQLIALREAGCNWGQGPLFGKPFSSQQLVNHFQTESSRSL